ncbi:diguanylate cyclase [Nitrosomonas sp.]|uniref:sensor domain-containing diguanylate cyclase n=1 Tax=Nitrosomonas sp. TaxID=42353 RepID=UPI0026277122|nr:diguanylate cyclase [Nitrosomonas sp.]
MTNKLMHPTFRISIALVALTISVLLIGELLGIVPDKSQATLDARKSFSETLAVQLVLAAERNDSTQVKTTLNLLVKRNPEVLSAAVRRNDGTFYAVAGDHDTIWQPSTDDNSSLDYIQVPIMQNDQLWGTVELSYAPPPDFYHWPGIKNSFWGMLLYVAIVSFLGYLFFLKRVLKELDPSRVIPERVKKAFDTLTEGILILNDKEQIVLANTAFCKNVGLHDTYLLGKEASSLAWNSSATEQLKENRVLPWIATLTDGKAQADIRLKFEGENSHIFMVNCSEILGDDNQRRGALVTFDDVTELEAKNIELEVMLKEIEISRNEISRQNNELKIIAEVDPLTQCYNRRAFHAYFDKIFNNARNQHTNLVCIMLDIDHFKSINDNYGHPVGDEVIKLVADTIRENLREADIVGRYGGEEFCLILPNLDDAMAFEIAERLRINIMNSSRYDVLGIKHATISLGLSSIAHATQNPSELINLADKALYYAKKNGRNRVAVWSDQLDSNADIAISDKTPDK